MRSRSNSAPDLSRLVLVILAVLAIGAMVSLIFDGDDPADAPIEPTEIPIFTSTSVMVDTETPTPTEPEAVPTSTVAPTEEPTTVSDLALQCEEICLVRSANIEPVESTLRSFSIPASHSTSEWIWFFAGTEPIGDLESQDIELVLVLDSTSTTNLYVATLPADRDSFDALSGWGEIIDSAGKTAIVTVPEVPAYIGGTSDLGIDVLKFPPATVTNSVDELEQLGADDLWSVLEQVSTDNIVEHVEILQGMSSTDGTGVGTRQYLQPGNVMAAEYLYTELAAMGLEVWYEDFMTPEGTLASNVIAEVPGADDSAIYGVLAHFDSTSTDFQNAPGADDNATGVAGALEIARILSGYELQYPVHIVMVNAEETGIIGSRVFAQNAAANGVPYEGIFNLDSIGSSRSGPIVWLNGDANSEWMMSLMIRVNNNYGFGQTIQARTNPNIVADDNRLRDVGFESILIARELFGTSDVHHTPSDLLGAVHFPYVVSLTQMTLVCIAALVVFE